MDPTLPSHHFQAVSVHPGEPGSPTPGAAPILLVDDDARNLLALEAILSFPDYSLVKAQTGQAALLALLDHDYAVIVLDVQLPDLSGIELAKLIKQRKRTRHVPIIFLTAHFRESDHAALGYDVGAVDYLVKPVQPAVLRSKVGVFVDLFRKNQALADLNRSMEAEMSVRKVAEERFRIVVEAAPSAMVVYDEAGKVTLVNSQAERLFGQRREALIGIAIDKLVPREILERTPLAGSEPALTSDGVSETLIRNADAGEIPVEIKLVLLESTQGPRILASIVDITVRKQAEEALWRANAELEAKNIAIQQQAEERLRRLQAEAAQAEAEAANEAKDRFLAMLSHELRTPLSPVLHMATLLDESPECSRELREMVETIRRNVQLEARLIDDLLDLARVRNGKLRLQRENTDAHETLARAIEICRPDIETAQLRLDTRFCAQRFILDADPARLQQIFWNLISNAVKFTPHGGVLTVATADDADKQMFCVEVTDTGLGIEPQRLQGIFNAFEQVDGEGRRGLGLGLAICNALAEFHGGHISARSPGLGLGSTFTVRLPVVDAAPARSKSTGPATAASAEVSLRILLAEDHQDTAGALVRLLKRRGHEVRAAASVGAALEMAREFPMDVLITDIGLPDATGYELFAQLKSVRGDAPLWGVALSGFGMEEDIARSERAGFYDHFTKPVDFEQLRRCLAEIGKYVEENGAPK